MDREVEIARDVIKGAVEEAGLKVVNILLFGSRARGDYRRDSDWDFYVIVDRDIHFSERREISRRIRRKLAELKIPNDIIIQSVSVVDRRKDDVGCLAYYVLREGVSVYE